MADTAPRAKEGNPPTTAGDPHLLAQRILSQLTDEARHILGVVGLPGTGKSTMAAHVAAALSAHTSVVVVPMDGFHLGQAIIRGTELEHRKGAADTFDSAGFALLMRRLRTCTEPVVYAPLYDRAIEEPIAASIAIPRTTQVVIIEGNYLLSAGRDWSRARRAINEIWYVDTPQQLRVDRLIQRHVAFGKSVEQATAWVRTSDEVNARIIAKTRHRAHLIITT